MIKKCIALIAVLGLGSFAMYAIDPASQSYAPYIFKKNPADPSDREGQLRWENYQICVKKATDVEDLLKCKTEIILKKHGLTD